MEEMNQEIVNSHLQHYFSLLRIKKAESGCNQQLELEIRTIEATLKALGVELEDFDFLK